MDVHFVESEDEMPKILYKYRTWNKEEHKRLLTHTEIYYASPSEFNEVTECNLERDYDSITDDMILKYCKNKAMREVENGIINISEVSSRTTHLYRNNLFHDLENRKESEVNFRKELNDTLSIFSSSESGINERLWNTFAGDKRGYCVGIDFSEIYGDDEIFGACAKVSYYDEKSPPRIPPITFSSDERIQYMMKTIYSLPNKFQDEEEFRFSKMYIKNRIVSIKPEWIKEVILGSEMFENDKKEIISIVKEKYPHAVVKRLFVEPTFGILSIVDLE